MKKLKLVQLVALLGAVSLISSGCVKLNMDLTVSNSDTVSGSMVFAFSKEIAELGGASGDSGTPTNGLLGDAENVTVTAFDDGEFVGSTYSFENLPLENFKPNISDSSIFGIERVGDDIIVSGVLDSSSEGSELEDNPFGAAFVSGIMESTDIRISISLPGELIESNGEVNGQTVTWYGKFGERIEMSAVSNSPQSVPIDWLVIGGIAIIATIAGTLVFFLTRRKPKTEGPIIKPS